MIRIRQFRGEMQESWEAGKLGSICLAIEIAYHILTASKVDIDVNLVLLVACSRCHADDNSLEHRL